MNATTESPIVGNSPRSVDELLGLGAFESPLSAAKEKLTIPELWKMLGLPGVPATSCRSPFREDRHASFSVFADGCRWHDHATGQGGDAADFIAIACDLSLPDACRRLIAMGGGMHGFQHFHRAEKRSTPSDDGVRKRRGWPWFRKPLEVDIQDIALQRGLSPQGVSIAVGRGLLYCMNTVEGSAWVLTDSRRKCAQARRMDGSLWKRIEAKAWTLPGSKVAWPLGIREAVSYEKIILVEGGPDLLAALHLAWDSGIAEKRGVVAMLGAGNKIPDEALEHFKGKKVQVIPHADEAGQAAAVHWVSRLQTVCEEVDVFDLRLHEFSDGVLVNDLNDFVLMLKELKDMDDRLELMGLALNA